MLVSSDNSGYSSIPSRFIDYPKRKMPAHIELASPYLLSPFLAATESLLSP
jgi:hypothetical protein